MDVNINVGAVNVADGVERSNECSSSSNDSVKNNNVYGSITTRPTNTVAFTSVMENSYTSDEHAQQNIVQNKTNVSAVDNNDVTVRVPTTITNSNTNTNNNNIRSTCTNKSNELSDGRCGNSIAVSSNNSKFAGNTRVSGGKILANFKSGVNFGNIFTGRNKKSTTSNVDNFCLEKLYEAVDRGLTITDTLKNNCIDQTSTTTTTTRDSSCNNNNNNNNNNNDDGGNNLIDQRCSSKLSVDSNSTLINDIPSVSTANIYTSLFSNKKKVTLVTDEIPRSKEQCLHNETESLKKELIWLLTYEVKNALTQLRNVLVQCVFKFPPPLSTLLADSIEIEGFIYVPTPASTSKQTASATCPPSCTAYTTNTNTTTTTTTTTNNNNNNNTVIASTSSRSSTAVHPQRNSSTVSSSSEGNHEKDPKVNSIAAAKKQKKTAVFNVAATKTTTSGNHGRPIISANSTNSIGCRKIGFNRRQNRRDFFAANNTDAFSSSSGSSSNNNYFERQYVLTTPTMESPKTILTMSGADIVVADIEFKLHNSGRQHHGGTIYRTSIKNERPWKLQQLQDTVNHLQQSFLHVDDMLKESENFCSIDEVFHSLNKILTSLLRGRAGLMIPKKCNVRDLVKYKGAKFLYPPLPDDLLLHFYLESHTLILAVYRLNIVKSSSRSGNNNNNNNNNNNINYDNSDMVYACTCPVPWVNDVLIMLEIALQVGQQLKDKFTVFAQYKDLTLSPNWRRRSATNPNIPNVTLHP